MRYYAILAGFSLVWVAAVVAGCSGQTQVSTSSYVYTARHFAPMLTPAVAADGTLYVANGDKLLHYSAEGEPLGEIFLPVELTQHDAPSFIWPKAYATRHGAIFIRLELDKIGMLDAAGHMAWIWAEGNKLTELLPLGNGMLLEQWPGDQVEITHLDDTGQVRWHVPGARLEQDCVQVDNLDRVYVLSDGRLTVLDAAGRELLSINPPDSTRFIRLAAVGMGLVLLSTEDGLVCYDQDGTIIWNKHLAGSSAEYESGLVLNPERIALNLHLPASNRYIVEVLDQNGAVIAQSDNPQASFVASASAEYLLTAEITARGYRSLLRNADGIPLREFALPDAPPAPDVYPGAIVPTCNAFMSLRFGPAGRLYYSSQATLHCLSLEGVELWHAAGTAFYDTEESTATIAD